MVKEKKKKLKITSKDFRQGEQFVIADVLNFCSGSPLSIYANSTGVKNPEMVFRGALFSKDRLISEQYLLNYKRTESGMTTMLGVGNYRSSSIMMSLANRDLKNDKKELIQLPDYKNIKTSLGAAVRSRRSVRKYSGKSMSLQDLSTILFHSLGITGYFELKNMPACETLKGKSKIEQRAAASGGGLYPIDFYFLATDIADLKNGLYQYIPQHHALKEVKPGIDNLDPNSYGFLGEIEGEKSNFTCFFAYRLYDNSRKYGDLGLCFALIEVGSIMQNIHLSCNALHYGACEIGGFIKNNCEKLIQLDSVTEHVVHMAIIGQQ